MTVGIFLASAGGVHPINDHRDLDVWQASMHLAQQSIEAISPFTHTQNVTVGFQLRRCLVSIPANIAEGRGRGTTREFIQYLRIARGSLAEVVTLLDLAARLHYLPAATLNPLLVLANRVSAMLTRLVQALRRKQA